MLDEFAFMMRTKVQITFFNFHVLEVYRPVARIFYGWVRSVDYTDQRAPEALFTRGVRGHAPPGNFEN